MKIPILSLVSARLAGAASLLLIPAAVIAHPYATSLTNASGVISFRLNESADTVKVLWNSGGSSFDLGPLPRGLTVTNLSAQGITAPFKVEVAKTGTGVPTLISDNSNTNNMFWGPRSLAVNKRPASPYFGRIYVGNTAAGTPSGSGRPQTEGIYLLNADSSDAVGQGNTALTGGISMAPVGNQAMPWRLRVGDADDNLYICNWSDPLGNLFVTDANVSPGSGTNVFALFAGPYTANLPPEYNHGSVSEVYVTGSLANGDLTVYSVDEDYESIPGLLGELNSIWRYDIGAESLPWSNAPNAKLATPAISFVGQTMGLDRGANGYFYLLDSRTAGGENCLQVVDPSGPYVIYESRPDSLSQGFPRDILSNSVSVAVSPDQKYLAVQRTPGQVVVVPLIDGIPNLAGRMEFVGNGNNSRQIIFDAANNIYTVGNSSERLRIWSLGLSTTATTGSDGTFVLTTPGNSVSIAKDVDTISEEGATSANITLTRVNETEDYGAPLVVNLTTNGSTAVRGQDYVLQTNGVTFTTDAVTIPANVTTLNIAVVAVDDATPEPTETVVLGVAGGVNYTTGIPASQTLSILDNEPPQLRVAALSTNLYERLPNDLARLTIQRWGDLNAGTFYVYDTDLVLSGSAVKDTDYTVMNLPVSFDPGVASITVSALAPIDNNLVDGPRTITVGLKAGEGFTAATNTASTTITDDDLPPATPIFAADFNDPEGLANWNVLFADASTPVIEDYNLTFAFDYSSLSVPPAPHGEDTYGLYLQVNKNDGTAAAAALNIYPKNQTFSGDYVVRFDMYLIVGAGASTTEYALFGINHSGTKTNWFRNSAGGVPSGSFDGLFYGIESDGAALGDYVLYSSPTTTGNNPTALTPGRNASTLTQVFKTPPFFAGGAPSNPEYNSQASWADVEISTIGGVVTLKINQTTIFSYTNTTTYTSGNIMLGYTDAYDSVGPAASGVIYDNLRVINLTAPTVVITGINVVGGNVVINFTGPASDLASAYTLQEAPAATGPYGDVSATIIGSGGNYTATRALGGAAQFYRIKRN